MTLAELLTQTVVAAERSPFFHGTVTTGKITLVVVVVLLVLLGVTFLLRRFFKRHAWIDRAHRLLIYILTMLGVLILILGGILGLILPVVPGLLFLLLAMLLLRRYYRNKWMDRQIKHLSWKLRFRRSVRKVRQRIRRTKLGKALRKIRRRRVAGEQDARTHK